MRIAFKEIPEMGMYDALTDTGHQVEFEVDKVVLNNLKKVGEVLQNLYIEYKNNVKILQMIWIVIDPSIDERNTPTKIGEIHG